MSERPTPEQEVVLLIAQLETISRDLNKLAEGAPEHNFTNLAASEKCQEAIRILQRL